MSSCPITTNFVAFDEQQEVAGDLPTAFAITPLFDASRERMIWGLRRGCLIGPNLIGLALYCGRIRVLHLEPMGRATRAVGRVLPLRDNPF